MLQFRRLKKKLLPGHRTLLVASAAFFFISTSCSYLFNRSKNIDTTRMLSYNIRNCLGTDGVTDYRRVASIITRIDPDVAAIQEIDSCTARSKGVFVLEQLASLTGMHAVYSPSISYQGGKYGIGILSKEKPLSWRRINLPGREEQRSLLIVEFRNYTFCCTHFSLNEEDRLASAEIINKEFMKSEKLVFLAGDFNATPSSEVMKRLSGYWSIINDPGDPTSPSEKPARCIDYILNLQSERHQVHTLSTKVEPEPLASDHLPVWAEIEIR